MVAASLEASQTFCADSVDMVDVRDVKMTIDDGSSEALGSFGDVLCWAKGRLLW
jgi:hypothetical protein